MIELKVKSNYFVGLSVLKDWIWLSECAYYGLIVFHLHVIWERLVKE